MAAMKKVAGSAAAAADQEWQEVCGWMKTGPWGCTQIMINKVMKKPAAVMKKPAAKKPAMKAAMEKLAKEAAKKPAKKAAKKPGMTNTKKK